MSSAEKRAAVLPLPENSLLTSSLTVVRHFSRGEQLDLQVNGKAMCYLILEGTVAVYRSSTT
jgi:hypothetical protein